MDTKYVAISDEEQVLFFDDLEELRDYFSDEEEIYVFEMCKAKTFVFKTTLQQVKKED